MAEKIEKYSKNTPYAIIFKSGRLYEMQRIKARTISQRVYLQYLVSDCSDFPSKLNNTCLKLNHDFCWKNRHWTHVSLKREEISKIANKDFKTTVQGCYTPNLKTIVAVVMELNTAEYSNKKVEETGVSNLSAPSLWTEDWKQRPMASEWCHSVNAHATIFSRAFICSIYIGKKEKLYAGRRRTIC